MTLYAQIDVGFARDPKMLRAGPLGRLLYIQCVLHCREDLTDGLILEALLPVVAVDIPNPRRLMEKLVDVGALLEATDGWQIPEHAWAKRNPTRIEVEAKRDAETARKASYRNGKAVSR